MSEKIKVCYIIEEINIQEHMDTSMEIDRFSSIMWN
jgi:hypothetical protein